MKKCLDIGTIQAFLDGETAPQTSVSVSNHVAACDNCALLMSDAEEQSSAVFSILEREMNSMVPTQRLWTKINETIEVEKARTPFWKRAYDVIALYLATPSMAAACGLLVVVGLLAVVWSGSDNGSIDMAKNPRENREQLTSPNTLPEPARPTVTEVTTYETTDMTPGPLNASTREGDAPRVIRADHRDSDNSINGNRIRQRGDEMARPMNLMYLPGEESYIKTINELKASVEDQKDLVLSPSSRVDFERDLAVVDDAIRRMKGVVAKDPNNQAARQVLYAAYQDKIDILNSVGQREELIASLK
jgi:hypothetical protein